MKGVGMYVVVKPVKGIMRKTKSGLDIPPQLNDRFVAGVIISASEEIGFQQFKLEEGQDVLFDKNAGHDIKGADGENYRVVQCRDIAVIL